MADNHRIGYHASVFASGALSEINAFAIGASLLDPRAQIILTWIARVRLAVAPARLCESGDLPRDVRGNRQFMQRRSVRLGS